MKQQGIPFDDGGIVRLAVKQGKPTKHKRDDYEHQRELINICLNCTRPRCGGCVQDKRFRKQRKLTKEELEA